MSSITIPDGVTNIGSNAFHYCESLSSIIIPSSVTRIDDGVFIGCIKLTSMTVLAVTPPTLGDITISTATIAIYVPSASVNTYKTASGWSSYASKIQSIPDE